MPDRILIGVAWPYANGPLHLGHIAGSYLPADIFARYHRMRGNDVLMVSGSDAHGTPITLRAEADGLPPREIVERYTASFHDCWERFGISFDLFTTTMTDTHRETVHELIGALQEGGYLYSATMPVAYSPDFSRFLPDRYVEGTCPYCGNDRARGDQCDNCGHTLDPTDLISPYYRRDDGRYPVEIRETEHLFFRLSAFEEQLKDWVATKDAWRSNVRNFTLGYLGEGLKDRAITRNLEWGVPVPMEGYADRRIYVWFEAVIGYYSASREWAWRSGDPDAWRAYWQDGAARSYYFMGKDNIPFHTIIWPAILLGAGGLNLPTDVPANEYLGIEGEKLSTSRNWAVWLPDYLDRLPPDPLRYHLAAAMPETSDSDFSWAEYVRRNNDELVATFGNLVHRVLNLVARNCEGRVPEAAQLADIDRALLAKSDATLDAVAESLDDAPRFREALGHAMALARDANRYIDAKAPWRQVREDVEGAATTLSTALYAIAALRQMLYPFIPFSAQRLHELLGAEGAVAAVGWRVDAPAPGTALPSPTPLFAKLDDSLADEMLAMLGA